jgi:hypothetical protein
MASRSDMSIYDRLRIKYGLAENPTPTEVDRWLREIPLNESKGYSAEAAARIAASGSFRGFETRVYASEADTIQSLLDAARNK